MSDSDKEYRIKSHLKTEEDITTPHESAQDTVPDGGFQAWPQVLLTHLMSFTTWGSVNSFGVFQTYYLETLRRPHSDIAWIGTFQSGRATDAGYFRETFTIGAVFLLIGVFMTSPCAEYWQLFLAQGLCTGIGNGLVFCSTLAILPTYFKRYRAIALGISASGTATGGMVIPAIIEALLPRIGFPWTTRVPPRKSGPIVEWAAFKEPSYVLFSVGAFFSFWGIYLAYWYISECAKTVGISQNSAFNLLIITNAVGLLGRLIPAWFTDKYTGAMNMMIPFVALSSVLLYCWAPITTERGLFAFSVLYGIFSAAVNGLFPAALSGLTTDFQKMGVFTTVSFACLTGSPIAGSLISARNGRYLDMEMFAANLMMIGALALTVARILRTGLVFRVRV